MPNPGARNREFIRKTVANFFYGLNIQGLGNIYPGTPLTELMDEGQPGSLYRANLSVHVVDIAESFRVLTGPADPGGDFAHYDVMLSLKHICTSVDGSDWWAAEDDHDRILDEVKGALKGGGRDLGRPDVVLQAGTYPPESSIRSETEEPFYDGGIRGQWSRIFFTVTQYIQRQP